MTTQTTPLLGCPRSCPPSTPSSAVCCASACRWGPTCCSPCAAAPAVQPRTLPRGDPAGGRPRLRRPAPSARPTGCATCGPTATRRCAAGAASIPVTAVELPVDEAARVLSAAFPRFLALPVASWMLRWLYKMPAHPTADDYRREAREHPMFELRPPSRVRKSRERCRIAESLGGSRPAGRGRRADEEALAEGDVERAEALRSPLTESLRR